MGQEEYAPVGAALPNARLRALSRNFLAGLLPFGLFVALDWIEIRSRFPVEVDLLLLTPVGLMLHLLVPIGFWAANRTAFSRRSRPRTYRFLLALALTAVWWAVALPLLIFVHIALGGRT